MRQTTQVGLDQVWLVLGISAQGQMLNLIHPKKMGLGADQSYREAEKSHGFGEIPDCLGPLFGRLLYVFFFSTSFSPKPNATDVAGCSQSPFRCRFPGRLESWVYPVSGCFKSSIALLQADLGEGEQ